MHFFKKEYTKYSPENKSWKGAMFIAFVTILLLLLFQPFGFRGKDFGLKMLLFPGYSLLTFLYAMLDFSVIKKLAKKRSWTIKDELINIFISVVLITLAVHVYTYFAAKDMPFTFQWYSKLFYHVASLLVLISILEYLYYNYKKINLFSTELHSQYEDVKKKLDIAEVQNKEKLVVSLENEQLEINRNKIISIESIGNYLEFVLSEDKKNKKIKKRGRLHQVEKDLDLFPEFIRCHRAFIVNLKYVTELKGNIKNAKLVLDTITQEIPVSRLYYKTVKEKRETLIFS